MGCREKVRRQIGRKVRPSQQVLKVKIDGAPRKREATPESAVWQATSRKSARNGAPPVVSLDVQKTTPHYTSPLKWPTRRGMLSAQELTVNLTQVVINRVA